MKGKVWTLLVGVLIGAAVALPLTAMAASWPVRFDSGSAMSGMMRSMMATDQQRPDTSNQEAQEGEPEKSEAHHRMHEMMDTMHGEGFSERMHETMPGSEEMMEQCAAMMDMMQNMQGMMNGMGVMMGSGGMMNMMRMSGGMDSNGMNDTCARMMDQHGEGMTPEQCEAMMGQGQESMRQHCQIINESASPS